MSITFIKTFGTLKDENIIFILDGVTYFRLDGIFFRVLEHEVGYSKTYRICNQMTIERLIQRDNDNKISNAYVVTSEELEKILISGCNSSMNRINTKYDVERMDFSVGNNFVIYKDLE